MSQINGFTKNVNVDFKLFKSSNLYLNIMVRESLTLSQYVISRKIDMIFKSLNQTIWVSNSVKDYKILFRLLESRESYN